MILHRNKKQKQRLAFLLIAIMLSDVLLPVTLHALTSGPSQPEVQSFEPVGTSEMVDLFSGDFNYNIPLFELPGPDGGYPFNLAYHGGISMEQEASWTGLGWNINAGVINRQMRGIPDDFAGDKIVKTADVKPAFTIGLGLGVDLELFGLDPDILSVGLGIGVTPYYNNYKGFGYSVSLSPGLKFGVGDNLSIGLGASMTTDMYDGKTYGANFSLTFKDKSDDAVSKGLSLSSSLNYNSRLGDTQIGLGVSAYRRTSPGSKPDKNGGSNTYWNESKSVGGGNSISLNNRAEYVPSIVNEMKASNLHVGVKVGLGISGVLTDVEVSGFYNIQKLKHRNKPVATPAYGFLGLGKLPENDNISNKEFPYLLDFNREADGMVDKSTKHLGVPVITNDIFSIAGQGVGGMFQANRSSVGFVRDKSNENIGNGGSIGLEFGASTYPHFGASGIYNHSETNNFLWDLGELKDKYNFENKSDDPYFEQVYFKVQGDKILEDENDVTHYLNGLEEPSYIPVQGKGFKSHLKSKSNESFSYQPNLKERRKRNSNVEAIENKYLTDDDNVLTEFEIKYFTDINDNQRNVYKELHGTLNRTNENRPNHIGGFMTLSPQGSRYIYGLPAYNTRHEEHAFSVPVPDDADFTAALKQSTTPITGNDYKDYKDHGDKYKDVLEVPEYTHAFLLTSVLGNDYVDVTNNGITDDDLGYWVKFNYVKAPEKYGWRTPFRNANYMPGNISDPKDDKGRFMYGERENWYLATAETKTHIAEFVLEERDDARGWSATKTNNLDAHSYALKEILLFSKKERYNDMELIPDAVPIKKIHLAYANNDGDATTQSLCPGIHNAASGGKLTLTQVWFTYRNNLRGANNKYRFDYESQDAKSNPPYNSHSYDCWGCYRDNDKIPAPDYPASYPYVPQYFNDNTTSTSNDTTAVAWTLRKVTTPSGAVINIEYEADDYAYVQNKKAMQMYSLATDQMGNSNYTDCYSGHGNQFSSDNVGDYVMVDLPQGFQQEQISELFDHTEQLYFKILTPLIQRKETNGEESAYKEFVSGYVDIDMVKTLHPLNQINGSSGFKIYLKPFKGGKYGKEIHPLKLAAMDNLQLNRSDLIYLLENPIPISEGSDNDSKAQKRDRLRALVGPILNMFKFNHNFYAKANAKCKTGVHFEPLHSFVRLNNVNGFKEGGGLRVKNVVMKEHENATDEYGQHYDYTTYDEESGNRISSGVATYEPQIGGEQNALKKAIKFDRQVTVKTNFKLFTEFPYNESYFPAPSVGYSKVTVKSLNTKRIEDAVQDIANSPYHDVNGIAVPATGTTVNEFYTCKDFPVYIDATELGVAETKVEQHRRNIIPLIGQVIEDYLGVSQGYMIELNDMHGKPKSVATYAQKQSGEQETTPYNSVTYFYKNKNATINGLPNAKRVTSKVDALLQNGDKKEMLLGLDYDMFMDFRASYVKSINDGLNFNTDLTAPFWIPFLNFMPTIGHDTKELRMIVTNKIIWRSGIMEKVVVKNENSTITTKNLCYDSQTGSVLLSEVQNNFDNPVYNLNIPGWWKYEGMGPAYKNLGLKIKGIITEDPDDEKLFLVKHATQGEQITKHLYPGDEFVVEINNTFYKAYVMRIGGGYFKIDFDLKQPDLTPGAILNDVPMYLTRSGRRNHLDINAGSFTTLINPLTDDKYSCHENE